jgi:hypothetical protein
MYGTAERDWIHKRGLLPRAGDSSIQVLFEDDLQVLDVV